ncbi:hypothetical protein [Vibrio panuliri]|uniref:Porin n=1 Tax=Vibrio panuliri TaxID=1381081 RepID=A0ABX3F4U6_9VIBR|nr:hypothetical protein F7O85_11135 [Vibrio panuliri]OLQ84962.1 hypothetical protein BIY20_16715 [Vibrio panuliri]
MKNKRLALLASGICVMLPTLTAVAGSALVLPGLHEPSLDLQGRTLSAQDVIEWEIEHSELVFGAYPSRSDNERTQAVGYMYNQKLELNSGHIENQLRHYAEEHDVDYEDFFLHFAEDTIIAEVDPSHGENTLLNRKPMIVGYTANSDHAGFWLYQSPPWDADVFENHHNGGALYVYHSEMFDRLLLKFSQFAQGGEFSIEYPSAVDSHGQVIEWSKFDIKKDKTLNMTKNQNVIWHMPSDWIRATTHDGSGATYGGGQYFGSTFVRDGGRLYVVRIRWQGDEEDTRPRLKEVKLKNTFSVVKLDDAPTHTPSGREVHAWRKIRGFDATADLNQDNYLSWTEFKNRNHKNATARFRWESRVIPFGRMWNQASSWAVTNIAHPQFLDAMHSAYHTDWAEQGLNGAYNDDTNKLIGANQFTVYSGGLVTELGLVVDSEEADALYKQQFSGFLNGLAERQSGALIGLNIGTANLYGRNGQSHLIEAGSLYLREHYLFPSTGFSGYAGIAKFWDNSALAAQERRVIFQATTRYGRVQYLGNTAANWQQDQYSTLAAYYLHHHPQRSYFNQWNNGFIYGSGKTTADNFWQSDVAKNIAYQPTALQAIDLGEPANAIPDGFQPIPLMLSTQTPAPADYTIVGDSTSNAVFHADLPNGMVEVLPTYVYFLYQSEQQVVQGGPQEMVLAREFTNGRVLYRTDFFGRNQDYYSAEPIRITLEQPMRPVDGQGNIGNYVNQIEIGGYQGMILLY